jgi:hypothetical protein
MSPAPTSSLPELTRPNFYTGQLLSVDDVRAEQVYQRERARLHNRLLHGWGVVDGLDARSSGGQIVIGPGLALDPHGDEIVLTHEATLRPSPGLAGCAAQFVVARLLETLTEPVAVADGVAFRRIVLGASIELADVAPRGHDGAVAIARLLWRTSHWRVDTRYRRRRAKH